MPCGRAPRARVRGPHPGSVLAAATASAVRSIVRLVRTTGGRDSLNPAGVATRGLGARGHPGDGMHDGEHHTADPHGALRGVVEDARRLIELLVTADAPEDALLAAGAHVQQAVAALGSFRTGSGRRSVSNPGSQDPAVLMPFDCVLGPL